MKNYCIYYEDTSGVFHIEEYKTWSEAYAVDCLKHPVKAIHKISIQPNTVVIGSLILDKNKIVGFKNNYNTIDLLAFIK